MESFTEHVKMRVKVVGQLECGSFTRLWLTLEPLSENYIGFLGQPNHHQRSIHCQHAQKIPWAQETSMQCLTHVKTQINH